MDFYETAGLVKMFVPFYTTGKNPGSAGATVGV